MIECAPQLPTTRSAKLCPLAVSDRLKIPYEPKYFKYEFTFGRSPEEFLSILLQNGFLKFMSSFEAESEDLKLSPQVKIQVKKTSHGVVFRPIDQKVKTVVDDKTWWVWQGVPGY